MSRAVSAASNRSSQASTRACGEPTGASRPIVCAIATPASIDICVISITGSGGGEGQPLQGIACLGECCGRHPLSASPRRRGRWTVSVPSAVPPGRSLPDHARDLIRMHEAVISGRRPPMRPRGIVFRSWSRVRRLGLQADALNVRGRLAGEELALRREVSPLRGVVTELRQVVGAMSDASHVLLVITDRDGVVLWREGTPAVRRRADGLGFCEGAEWSERRVGTNAIGTALVEAAPVELLAGEHFERRQHSWYCTAAPVHDPRTGELLGVINVSGP